MNDIRKGEFNRLADAFARVVSNEHGEYHAITFRTEHIHTLIAACRLAEYMMQECANRLTAEL